MIKKTQGFRLRDLTASFSFLVFQSQFMGLLFLGGSICGILLVSLLIWFIFGFDFFRIFFKPKEVQRITLKRCMKYIGGSAIYLVTSLFRMVGQVLVTPVSTLL